MTLTLTQLITNLQSLFIDDGTRFTTAICTACLRQALKDFNQAAPVHAADTIAIIAGQYEYELSETATVLAIIDVLLEGTDTYADNHTRLAYNAYWEDGRPFVRLQSPLSSGTLIVRYTIPHTVSGLDSASESTLPAAFDPILLDGAAFRGAYARAAGRIELINLNAGVVNLWLSIAADYKVAFETGLIIAERQAAPSIPAAVIPLPLSGGWNDQYHNPQDDLFQSTLDPNI